MTTYRPALRRNFATNEGFIIIQRVPTHRDWLETLADKSCTLTGHRFCNGLFGRVANAVDRSTSGFEIPVTPEQQQSFREWMGWNDDEDENDD